MPHLSQSSQRGQALVLFTLSVVVMLLMAGLVVDGGYAFSQRRLAQNAADFASMAGTRIVGEARTGQPDGAGTAGHVQEAITSVLAANQAELESAQYVNSVGAALGDVYGLGAIPSNAFGVVVNASTSWHPFFLGIVGISDWTASSTATSITPGESVGGEVLPVGVEDGAFQGLDPCPVDNLANCIDNLTSGQLNVGGQFGWLAFGLDNGSGGKCPWADPPGSLGMVEGGCLVSQTFLNYEIGTNGGANSYGCCTAVGQGGPDLIGGLTGNEVAGNRASTSKTRSRSGCRSGTR